MNKDAFNKLGILDQIEFINKKLKEGYSLSKLDSENIISSRKTISNRFDKAGYKLNKATNQYESIIEVIPDISPGNFSNPIISNEICITSEEYQESSNIVVQGDQANNKLLEDLILNYSSMNDKLNEVYNWYQESSNDVVIENNLTIEDFEGKIVTRSYKVYSDIQKEFADFCAGSKYRVQDLVSQAFKEFLDRYK